MDLWSDLFDQSTCLVSRLFNIVPFKPSFLLYVICFIGPGLISKLAVVFQIFLTDAGRWDETNFTISPKLTLSDWLFKCPGEGISILVLWVSKDGVLVFLLKVYRVFKFHKWCVCIYSKYDFSIFSSKEKSDPEWWLLTFCTCFTWEL